MAISTSNYKRTRIIFLVIFCVSIVSLLALSSYAVSAFQSIGLIKYTATPSTPTPTLTSIQFGATWTATPLQNVTVTLTLIPTFTLEPTATTVSLITPTDTPVPTPTPNAPFSATATYINSTIIHPEAACNWQGIAGTIVDASNADMLGIAVRLSGFYNNKSKNELTVSGIAPAYGQSGFEFFLGTLPIASDGLLSIQIFDQTGLPLSDTFYLSTFQDCDKNLILVKFRKNHEHGDLQTLTTTPTDTELLNFTKTPELIVTQYPEPIILPTASEPITSIKEDIFAIPAYLTTLLTSITSLIGFISTTVLSWKKERRELILSEIERKRLEAEIQKNSLEIDKLKKSARKKVVNKKTAKK